MDFKKLTEANLVRCEESFHPLESWSPTDWATAVAGETGEMCNLVKKMRRGDSIPVEEVGKELADIVIYADLLASRLGLDLSDCIVQKFNEVSDRVNSSVKLD